MKSEESRIPIKHELDHAIPTVIHDPEQDMNLLERWLRHAMENQFQFWGTATLLVVVLVVVSLLANGWRSGTATADEAWLKLEAAKTPSERVEIAKAYPNTTAERWALLQAANEFYGQGFSDLPANKDAALPTLKKALDLFLRVAEESPKDTAQARAAALGVARTHEARNELDKAAEWYRKIAETREWANTPEAKDAARLAALLKRPEVASFYKELYAYKAPEATLPGGGIGNFNLGGPSLLNGSGSGSGSGLILPDPMNVPPPPPTAAPKVEGPTTEPSRPDAPFTIDLKKDAPGADLPADPFTPAPAPTPEPAPAPAPATTPAPAPPPATEPAPRGELPSDPFAPSGNPNQ